MNDFVNLFLKLDQTNKTNDKIAALEEFLTKASPSDRMWMIALFTGKGPKRILSSRYLKEWMIQKSFLPPWLFDETHHVVGDLAETLALVLPPKTDLHRSSLSDWMSTIQSLSKKNLEEKKEKLLSIWDQLDSKERLVFNKVLIGGFRLGVSQNLLIRALANVSGLGVNVVAHRLMGDWNPNNIDPDFWLTASQEEMNSTRPYPFCLAYPLDMPIEELGPVSDWSAEWKWDGIRGQIVHRPGAFTIWSRGEEVVNDRFPELLQLQHILPPGLVLDGEILACQHDQILSFQALQQRIGRKKLTAAILAEIPVIFLAYDLLEWKGEDIRHQPFKIRRQQLEDLIKSLPEQQVLRLSPQLQGESWDSIREQRQQSRLHHAEGVMLKKWDSPYHVGRKRGDWWKWKVESYTVDGVLLYAQKGHGWRANVYSDYTFAVWHKGKLIPFAKAYSGLTKEELKDVDRFIKANTLEKFGPVRSVKPQLVFEIAFEGIQLSNRHKSGVAVRFPRIQRWRHDKRPEDADTLETLKALIDTPN
jgi:DNA ligase 1